MGYKSAADGVTKTGRTKGRNLGDSGPTVGIEGGKGKSGAKTGRTKGKNYGDDGKKLGIEGGKGSKGASSVTGQEMRKVGRNLARAKNQSKGK